MNKIIILIPVYNDWDSLKKLLIEINQNIKDLSEFTFDCFVVNDASTANQPLLNKPSQINSLKILNMKKIEVTLDVMHLELDIFTKMNNLNT